MFTLERDKETICAVSTPPGVGAIAVVRISGTQATDVALQLCPQLPKELESHKVYYGHLVDPISHSPVDEVLLTYFRQGKSFTSEDVIEISCHGSPAITQQILQSCIQLGVRLALPGEFTYRAFSSGRIDLVQAESILKLIESKSTHAAKVALRQLSGELSNEFQQIEEQLLWVMSRLEANIDFAAEDIELASTPELISRAQQALLKIENLLKSFSQGRMIHEGLRCAIIGAPNVGKSSLLNALTNTKRAIVSTEAGTTRDRIDVGIQIDGQRVLFMDTAGWRETENEIEKQGVQISKNAANEADVLLFLYDLKNLASRELLSELKNFPQPVIVVGNKLDLMPAEPKGTENDIYISATQDKGMDLIKERIRDMFKENFNEGSVHYISARQHEILLNMEKRVSTARNYLVDNMSPDIILFELNEALLCCYEALGKQYDDQVVDKIFKDFCLGK